VATGLNNLGQVVGWSDTADSLTHAFFWDQVTGLRDLGTPGGQYSRATAINDLGQVVGFGFTDEARQVAFIWDAARGMTILESPGTTAEARSINNDGVVVGVLDGRPVRWLPGQGPRELGYVLYEGRPVRINQSGLIAGDSDLPGQGSFAEAVIWNPDSTMTPLGSFSDAGSSARDMNRWGEVVGSSAHTAWDPLVATLWTRQHQIVDLNSYAPDGWSFSSSAGINSQGDIVGYGYDGTYNQAFVLYKQPESSVESVDDPLSASLRVWPNPSTGPVHIEWESRREGEARIHVFDSTGRRIDSFACAVSPGRTAVLWDPAAVSGRGGLRPEAAPGHGLYFLQVVQPDGTVRNGRLALYSRSPQAQ
jgi:probable HAF family extracellular repeat protein